MPEQPPTPPRPAILARWFWGSFGVVWTHTPRPTLFSRTQGRDSMHAACGCLSRWHAVLSHQTRTRRPADRRAGGFWARRADPSQRRFMFEFFRASCRAEAVFRFRAPATPVDTLTASGVGICVCVAALGVLFSQRMYLYMVVLSLSLTPRQASRIRTPTDRIKAYAARKPQRRAIEDEVRAEDRPAA